jgi:hypothetical protein
MSDTKQHGYECCMNHCRDCREMIGGYPASKHAPSCKWHKVERFYKVVPKGQKGPGCILETMAEVDDLRETPGDYDVTTVDLTRDQFEALREFDGF